MAVAWIAVPSLVSLREEINRLAPNRAKGADGTIGDTAHASKSSDHNPDETGAVPIHDADRLNEVHALDITTDLREPGLMLDMIVRFVVDRHRREVEDRLRYTIWNRTIWHVDTKWLPRPYNGSDPHTGHAHFSASYDTAREADASSWHLEEIPVALTAADKTWLSAEIAKATKAASLADDAVFAGLLNVKIGDAVNPTRTVGDILRDAAKLRGVLVGDPKDTGNAKLSPTSPLARLLTAEDRIAALLTAPGNGAA